MSTVLAPRVAAASGPGSSAERDGPYDASMLVQDVEPVRRSSASMIGGADVDLVEPFDALHPARALRVDLQHLVADHVDADEEHAVGHELLAHRLDDAALHVPDLERDRATARADVGPRVVARGDSAEGGQLPVALEDLSLEQEDPGITVLAAVDELLDDRVAVLEHRLRHLGEVRSRPRPRS